MGINLVFFSALFLIGFLWIEPDLSLYLFICLLLFFLFSALIVSLCFSVCGPFLCLSVNILCLCNLYLVLLVSLGVLCSCNNCTVVHVALSLCIYFKLSENDFLCMQFWYCRFWFLVFSYFWKIIGEVIRYTFVFVHFSLPNLSFCWCDRKTKYLSHYCWVNFVFIFISYHVMYQFVLSCVWFSICYSLFNSFECLVLYWLQNYCMIFAISKYEDFYIKSFPVFSMYLMAVSILVFTIMLSS